MNDLGGKPRALGDASSESLKLVVSELADDEDGLDSAVPIELGVDLRHDDVQRMLVRLVSKVAAGADGELHAADGPVTVEVIHDHGCWNGQLAGVDDQDVAVWGARLGHGDLLVDYQNVSVNILDLQKNVQHKHYHTNPEHLLQYKHDRNTYWQGNP